MHYPNGRKNNHTYKTLSIANRAQGFSNRGMTLEEDINAANTYYRDMDKAVIHKKPTPIQVVNVHYPKRSAAVITEGYFKQPSTTDYNGIYRGRHIDFEAKETKNKTRFPLANIHEHQIRHMKSIAKQGAVCFLIIRFSAYEETYYMPAEVLFRYWDAQFNGGKKSIRYETIVKEGYLVPFHYQARVNYLAVIDKLYF
ncbi:Holliday junction resolvase RecU [Lentibacillus juripiscarius]|uniref:Holliday junction resolvase RecU n=1 Tax=Lentibacillus juripiscarius TaxID=257446 RepID=A0ABW5V5T0_9BACI